MKRLVLWGGVIVVVVTAVVLVWFQPQKLVMDDTVDEAVPGTEQAAEDPADGENSGAEGSDGEAKAPEKLATGTFANLEHEVSGRAVVLETGDGTRYLRFEEFEVENGPDLRVYLSAAPGDGTYADDFVDLGALKGNIGDQNYEIPGSVDLDSHNNAVIWCRRFSVGFAVAELR